MGSCNCVNNASNEIYDDLIIGKEQKVKGVSNKYLLNACRDRT